MGIERYYQEDRKEGDWHTRLPASQPYFRSDWYLPAQGGERR